MKPDMRNQDHKTKKLTQLVNDVGERTPKSEQSVSLDSKTSDQEQELKEDASEGSSAILKSNRSNIV